jgi:predicted ABC-type ATPase
MGDIDVPAFQHSDGSAYMHIDPATGDFTPERKKLHDQIVESHLAGVRHPDGAPTYVMLGGGGGSGKTTALLKNPDLGIPGKGDAVHVNADDIKSALPESHQMNDKLDLTWASFTHEESSHLSKRVQAAAIERGLSVVDDGVGSDTKKVSRKMEAMRAKGYKTKAAYATIPTDEAVRRSALRATHPGADGLYRLPPPAALRAGHAGATTAFTSLASEFDTAVLYDNSGPHDVAATLVASATKGNPLTVHDPSAWAAFQSKADVPPGPFTP